MVVDSCVVEFCYGLVWGVDDGCVKVWKGIWYVVLLLGDLRFWMFEFFEWWIEVVDVIIFGLVCLQLVIFNMLFDLGVLQSEDCWSLNIWVLVDIEFGDGKFVMVWLYGGVYILGLGSQLFYNGCRLVVSGDVVVVMVNYWFGVFGFLDLLLCNMLW